VKNILINNENLSKYILIISVISGVIGPHLLSIDVGINLYFFRWFMLLIFLITFSKHLFLEKKIKKSDWISFYFNLFMLIWLMFSFAYIFFIEHLNDGLKSIFIIFLANVYIYVFQYLFNSVGNRWLYFFSVGIFISYILSVFVSIWELLTFNHLPSQYFENLPEYFQNSLATTAFSGNPNNFSVFLVLSSICLFYLLRYLNYFFKNIIIISIFVINPIIIFLNESRLAFYLYLLLMFYFFYKLYKINFQLKLIIFLFFILFIYNYQIVIDFYESIDFAKHIIQSDSLNDDSYAVRISHFNNFAYYTENRLGFGLGPGQYEALGNIHPYKVLISNPHNLFLEIGINFGIYILLLFILFLTIKMFFYYRINQLFFIFCLLFILTSPINSNYLNDNLTWIFIALIFNGYSGNFFLKKNFN
jgi:hypothetical protein